MRKIKILFIILLAIVGALLIYNHFDNKIKKNEVKDKFTAEYTLVKEGHVFEYKNIDEVVNLFNNGTGIIFFCDPATIWCQHYAKILDEVARENNIDKIYYIDIKEDRYFNSSKYLKIVEELQDYLNNDDLGNRRLNMPNVTFVKEGIVIANDNETSIISSDTDIEEFWTENKINDLKNKLKEYTNLLNEDKIIE